jgi:hypothetical protein
MALITLPGALGLALLAAGFPYVIMRITRQNVVVPLLALVVVVETADSLQKSVQTYRVKESYSGFLHKR